MNAPKIDSIKTVSAFVDAVRKKLNQHRSMDILIRTVLTGSLIILLVALFFVMQGYSVPLIAYAIVGVLTLVFGCLLSLIFRFSHEEAASQADSFYGLKDSVISCTHFAEEGKDGQFYDLQARQTQQLVNDAALTKIRYTVPVKLIALAVVFITVAAALGFKSPSDKVVARLKEEAATLQYTETANKELKELIDELDKSVEDPNEREMLEPDKLRKWIEELEETPDRKEAMRQYARLELKLNRAAESLMQRQDEKLMDMAAQELKTSDQLKELARKIEKKNYDSAAEDLTKMKPAQLNEKDLKKLSEKRKELAKLKAAAKRMAEAARSTARRNGNQTNADNNQGNLQKASASSKSEQQNQNASPESDGQLSENAELSEMIEDLEEAVDEYDEALEQMKKLDPDELDDFEECEECQNCRQCESDVDSELKRLGKS